ncbi:cell division control protein 42 [Fusarium austroafricanum]|uniref:Cell division control protein 42 n=1 Tax=Fusarium austroafricanum TaxID=2364996 RepID=A0A8H4PE91_9HYPO|nr:cell division control protein 42 [Fusarium austroafricanum]
MADPLSIAASIVGLLAAGGKVCEVLSTFINSTVDAPNSAAAALQNVEHMNLTLHSIQSLIDSLDTIDRSRKSLIQLDHLSIVVTHAVLTISELESIICREDSLMNRLRWVWNEKKVLTLLPRLETQKTSLSLMVTILQSKSQEDANNNHKTLLEKMEDVIEQNADLAQRLEKLEGVLTSDSRSIKFLHDASSIVSEKLSSKSFKRASMASLSRLASISQKRASIAISNPSIVAKSEFEEELEQSRVYSRTKLNESDVSFTSSSAPSNAWSMLSGTSLNDISVISAFRLPITANDIDLLAPGSTFSVLLTEKMSPGATDLEGTTNFSRKRVKSALYAPQRQPRPDKTTSRLLASALGGYQARKTIKIMVVGDRNALKSNLIQSYAYGKGAAYTPKSFDNFVVEVKVGNQLIRLTLHDTTGREAYASLRQSMYRETKVFLILSKKNNIESCRNVEEKWVPEVTNCCPDTPYLLVGTYRKQPVLPGTHSSETDVWDMNVRKIKDEEYLDCDVEDPAKARAVFNRAIAVVLGIK